MKTNTQKALTLSEVLTTLMIIGVIAAIILPTTIKNIEQQKKSSMLKKLYSSYNVNIQTVLNEANCASLSCLRAWGNDATQENEDGSNEAVPPTEHNGALADTRYFNIQNVCTNCFDDAVLPAGATSENSTAYILNNGVHVLIHDYVRNCTTNAHVTAILEAEAPRNSVDVCGVLVVDVTPDNRKHIPGGDTFGFFIADEPANGSYLIPMGLDGNKNQKNYDSVNSLINSDDDENNNQNNSVLGYNTTGDLFINGWSYENPANR